LQDNFNSINHLSAHPPILKRDTQLAKMVLKLYGPIMSTSGALFTILEKKTTRPIDIDRYAIRDYGTKEFKKISSILYFAESRVSVVFLYLSSTQVPQRPH